MTKIFKAHQGHIANRGHVSMSHDNMVRKPIPIPRAMKSPVVETAVDQELDKLRMKQSCVFKMWSIVIYVSVPLADTVKTKQRANFSRQLKVKTPQIIQDQSAGVTPNVLYSSHTPASAFLTLKALSATGNRECAFLPPVA